ncbi:macro domain-containing protein [Tissierella sp.]|uniref:macro domain-containing protein n=1 Tax=Tissierella sp. TaxID=41274 RepID=UPI0028AA61FF|nr:macro domain-containing protein [Tissierella sp.]
MLEFVSGNIFDYNADIRVNTVNCVGVMGAGVALMFKNRYPDMFIDYVDACKRNEVKPGKPHVWEHSDLISQCTIINFPTKVHWKNPSEYEYINKGLTWLRQFLLNKGNSTVTLPALGCGHGGLKWEIVKKMIIKYLGDLDAKILVFEPSSSTNSFNNKAYDAELEKRGIHKLLPHDEFYPSKLIGRSALEIYYKGNIELLRSKSVAIVVNRKSTDREKNALSLVINELPTSDFVFILGLSNSYETELAKVILSKGFRVVISIPYGILQLKVRKDLEMYWDYQKIIVLSTTSPTQTWKSYESFKSLQFRLKLADITLINNLEIQSIAQYENDIKKADNKVFYVNYWDTEVDFFNRLPAQRIGINSKTGKPNVLPLLYSLS